MKLNIGCGRTKIEGFLNVDISPMCNPDMVVDISDDISGLKLGEYEVIVAHDVLEHIPNLVKAMTNCLSLLKPGGIMDIIVPYDLSYGAWQDPTHVRAFNEKSWLYYFDWCWYLGWKEYGLRKIDLQYYVIDGLQRIQPSTMSPTVPRSIDMMRVLLKKEKL